MIEIKKFFSNIQGKTLIYILGAVGIFLLCLPGANSNETSESSSPKDDYCTVTEARLEEILQEIADVGNVKVMISAKNYGKIVLAKDEGNSGMETVVLNQKGGGEDAKVIEENYPEIQGVIIVCDGGKSNTVKIALTEAVCALLDVDAHKIKVFERERD